MPVRFEIENDRLFVRQSFDFPVIYLDHWAIRRLSEKKADGQRFANALKASGGTLIISHTNLAEITGPADPRHAEEISDFLECALPNIFFAQFDIKLAMRQETQTLEAGRRLMVPPDIELLRRLPDKAPAAFNLSRFAV
jgi:hypothetical protein